MPSVQTFMDVQRVKSWVWHHTEDYTIVKNDQEELCSIPINGIGYSHEIIECHNCLRSGKGESELWSHQNSLDLIGILDVIRKKVGLKYPQEQGE